MKTALVDLESSIRRDPFAVDVRLIYADALLEINDQDPRAQLIALSKKRDDGDTSIELAQSILQLELAMERSLTALLPKSTYVLCGFRHGLIEHIDVITRSARSAAVDDNVLATLFERPELHFLRRVDLRRCWPTSKRARSALLAALPKLLEAGTATAKPIDWLGIGTHALGASDVKALFDAFPRLEGLALVVLGHPWKVIESLASQVRLTDLEIASDELDEDALVALIHSDMKTRLKRLVLFTETEDVDFEDLAPLFKGRLMPALTSFGLISGLEEINDAFCRKIVTTPLFKKLTSLGIACDSLDLETTDWIEENGDLFANVALFTRPAYMLDGGDWDSVLDDLGTLLHDLDRDEEALQVRQELVIADPKSAWYWDNLGDSLRACDRWQEALEAHERVIKLDKKLTNAWQGKADALFELDRATESVHAWDRAIALLDGEDDAWAHNGRGLALQALGRYDEALVSFATAIVQDKNDKDSDVACYAQSNCAEVFHACGRLDEAYVAYEKLTKDRKTDGGFRCDAFNAMGRIRQLQGDLKSARRLYERAVKQAEDPSESVHPLTNLGRLFVETGDLEQALAIWKRICATEEADDYDRLQGAWVLLELGRAKQALAAFEAIDQEGFVTERALALDALGRTKEAIALLDAEIASPMEEGCVYRWVGEIFTRAVLLRQRGRGDDPATMKDMVDISHARFRPKPKTGKPNFAPLAIHAELIERATADGGGTVQCDAATCAAHAALVGLCAAHFDGAIEEAQARSIALAQHFEKRLDGALGREWELRRVAHLAGLQDAPLLLTTFRVVEGFALPNAILGVSALEKKKIHTKRVKVVKTKTKAKVKKAKR